MILLLPTDAKVTLISSLPLYSTKQIRVHAYSTCTRPSVLKRSVMLLVFYRVVVLLPSPPHFAIA
jgi:hypothetical protein